MMNWDYLLFYRWLALNAVGFALILAFQLQGMIVPVFLADTSYIVYLISVMFLYGMALCGYRVWKTSRELNAVKAGQASKLGYFANLRGADRESVKEAFEIKLFARISFVKYISSSLVMLGLVGTVIGFIMVLTNIPTNSVGDAAQVGQLVGALTKGMGVALYTTLVGSITNLWLNANYNMLRTGVVNLIAALLESPMQEVSAHE